MARCEQGLAHNFRVRQQGETLWICAAQAQDSAPLDPQRPGAINVLGVREVRFDCDGEGQWPDSSACIALLFSVLKGCERMGAHIEAAAMPEYLRKLWALYSGDTAEQARAPAQDQSGAGKGFGLQVRRASQWMGEGLFAVADFIGQVAMGLGRALSGRCPYSVRDFWAIFRTVTTDAVGIVALLAFLIGLIISFLGAVVLQRFGAEFAVSYLVGYGMFREMGAVMTGIIMAGRTGASYAARIGSMKANEELDALQTFGINPVDYVVLPRMLALVLAMPLLTIYANLIGVAGGYIVAVGMMGVPGPLFMDEMRSILGMWDLLLGLGKALSFGALVGIAGCLRGLQSGRSADGVGQATTEAVVLGITLIIIANALIDWAAASLGI